MIVSEYAATSPVLCISTPSNTSAPVSLFHENCGTLTQYALIEFFLTSPTSDSSIIALIATLIKSNPTVLLTYGNDLLARTLHSMTKSCLSLSIICILNGPDICSSMAIFRAIFPISLLTPSDKVFGSISDASPL
eukprot:NODE_108_length_19701_cov_0.369452.p12 type:complete len:135 gc:universal NODE_108_length_19701_cov_0.369452:18584-18180(-)